MTNDNIDKEANTDRISNIKDGNDDYIDFDKLFYPKTLAVIGVSKNKVSGMKFVFANEGWMKLGGKVYPINPKHKELYGFKVYPSLFDPEIPDIDLAVIAVPAKNVPQVVRDVGKKGVKFAIIFTSGFIEAGRVELQAELDAAINEVKDTTRFIGPNCLGVNNPYSKIHYYPGMVTIPGNVSYISQSGGMTARLSVWLSSIGVGMRHVVSIGNSVDLTPTDFIDYFIKDEKTHVIAFYLESIKNGRRFIEKASKATLLKPIILFKGGQSKEGGLAAKSHTGGLAGSYEIWKAMTEQYGIVLTDHFEEFADAVTTFVVTRNLPKDNRVAILLAGGGIGVEYTDICLRNGLKVPELSKETQEKLGQVFPDINTNFRNPIDLGEYGYVPAFFKKALEIIAGDPNISSIIFVREAERFEVFQEVLGVKNIQEQTIKDIKEALKNIKKPVFCSTSPNDQSPEFYKLRHDFKVKMIENGLPVIDYIPNVCKIITKMLKYRKYLESKKKI
ncbi:MAG: acetate--CoA ligase family protein [Promethearchaeota archaeon]